MTVLGNLNLDDYVEPQTFDDNSWVGVKCIDAEIKEGVGKDSGAPWEALDLVLNPQNYSEDFPEITNPKAIYYRIWLPTEGAESWKVQKALGQIKKIYDAIGEYPTGGDPDPDDFKGKMFVALLGVKENDSGTQNTVRTVKAA